MGFSFLGSCATATARGSSPLRCRRRAQTCNNTAVRRVYVCMCVCVSVCVCVSLVLPFRATRCVCVRVCLVVLVSLRRCVCVANHPENKSERRAPVPDRCAPGGLEQACSLTIQRTRSLTYGACALLFCKRAPVCACVRVCNPHQWHLREAHGMQHTDSDNAEA